jgi:hypothetical protein
LLVRFAGCKGRSIHIVGSHEIEPGSQGDRQLVERMIGSVLERQMPDADDIRDLLEVLEA